MIEIMTGMAKNLIALSAMMLLGASTSFGVIVYGDPGRLNAAPAGKLADSGWQYEGNFLGFTGTPIAPNYFITASHIGGGVGTLFSLNGLQYKTVARFDDPDSDLRIWKIDGIFSDYASLYTKKHERGKKMIVFGRGTDRGDPVMVKNKLKGWKWGSDDPTLSWGTNNISAVANLGGNAGNVIEFKFKGKKSKPDEASISEGDSGGGVFIKVHKRWELAGINLSTDGPFSFDNNPADAFSASLLDKGGLYTFTSDNRPVFTSDRGRNKPSINYVTRISTEMDWINSVLAGGASPDQFSADYFSTTVPEPALAWLALSVPLLVRRRHG